MGFCHQRHSCGPGTRSRHRGHRRAHLSNLDVHQRRAGKNKGYDYARTKSPEPQSAGTHGRQAGRRPQRLRFLFRAWRESTRSSALAPGRSRGPLRSRLRGAYSGSLRNSLCTSAWNSASLDTSVPDFVRRAFSSKYEDAVHRNSGQPHAQRYRYRRRFPS